MLKKYVRKPWGSKNSCEEFFSMISHCTCDPDFEHIGSQDALEQRNPISLQLSGVTAWVRSVIVPARRWWCPSGDPQPTVGLTAAGVSGWGTATCPSRPRTAHKEGAADKSTSNSYEVTPAQTSAYGADRLVPGTFRCSWTARGSDGREASALRWWPCSHDLQGHHPEPRSTWWRTNAWWLLMEKSAM